MALTLSNADAVLKEFYLPGIREQLNNDTPWLAQLEKNTRDISGRRAVIAAHTKRNSGVGARAEGGTLPTAGNQGTAEERVPLRYNYGRIQLNGQLLKATKGDRGSFVRALELETSGVTSDLRRDVARQSWGTSDGVIATCGTTTSDTVVVLATATSAVQMRQFEVGMTVDIGTLADHDSVAAAREITAVDTTNETITISGAAVTTSGSHYVFRAGSSGEITGLQTIVDNTGTLHNIDPSTHPVWKSVVKANGGTPRSLTENLMAQTVQEIQIAGGEFPSLAIASDGVHRSFASLLTSLKRFPGTVNLKGGYSGLDFTAGGPTIPVVWDRDCPANKMFFLSPKHIEEYQMSDWEWMDNDGAVLSRVSNTDAYEATLFKYHEQATTKRNAHGVLEDITES